MVDIEEGNRTIAATGAEGAATHHTPELDQATRTQRLTDGRATWRLPSLDRFLFDARIPSS